MVDALLASAKARKDAADWTKALIRSVQLRTGLHGYETAVRFLKDEPWPPDLLSRTALELFYAQSLVNYAQMYSWEVSKRERVESTGAVDLKAWTREQIYDAAIGAYVAIWKDREALGAQKVKALAEFVEVNDYPPGIRDTLRDSVAYFFAALLADTSGWSPEQSNAVFALDLAALLRADAASTANVAASSATRRSTRSSGSSRSSRTSRAGTPAGARRRPSSRRASRGCAASRARSRRTRIARRSEGPRGASAGDGEAAVVRHGTGAARGAPRAGRRARRARARARSGGGGPRGVPRLGRVAGAARRSWPAIQAPGLPRLRDAHRRREAPLDPRHAQERHAPVLPCIRSRPARAHRRSITRPEPSPSPARRVRGDPVQAARPAAEWSVALPATPDYREHRTYVVPPMEAKGLYVVAAPGGARFAGVNAPVSAASYLVSDLVLVTAQAPRPAPASSTTPRGGNGAGTLDVRAVSGATGRPLRGRIGRAAAR